MRLNTLRKNVGCRSCRKHVMHKLLGDQNICVPQHGWKEHETRNTSQLYMFHVHARFLGKAQRHTNCSTCFSLPYHMHVMSLSFVLSKQTVRSVIRLANIWRECVLCVPVRFINHISVNASCTFVECCVVSQSIASCRRLTWGTTNTTHPHKNTYIDGEIVMA